MCWWNPRLIFCSYEQGLDATKPRHETTSTRTLNEKFLTRRVYSRLILFQIKERVFCCWASTLVTSVSTMEVFLKPWSASKSQSRPMMLRSIVNQSSTMTGNTTYYMAICNVKIGLQMYQEGQIDMESWKTPMMKNVQIRKYKMSNLTMWGNKT